MRGALLKPILLAGVLAALVMAAPGAAEDESSEDTGVIAFASNRTGSTDVWVMNPDGTNPVDLTPVWGADVWPAWSPDARRIVFTRGRGFLRELWVMNANGTNQMQLTTNVVADIAPSWSPDGERIAVVRFGADFNIDIWVIDADGTGPELRLTDSPGFDGGPTWSPDGRWIAFMSAREGNAVYKTRSDGSGGLKRLTPLDMSGGTPSWSRDGDEIAFSDNVCFTCGESDVWILELDDAELTQVTDTSQNELFPDWSPDDERLVYERSEIVGDNLLPPDIFVVDADGGAPTNLTNSPGVVDATPRWSPEPDEDEDDD